MVGDDRGHERYLQPAPADGARAAVADVVFTGRVDDDELLAYYSAADAFLCLSEHEGFCVPLLEAMPGRAGAGLRCRRGGRDAAGRRPAAQREAARARGGAAAALDLGREPARSHACRQRGARLRLCARRASASCCWSASRLCWTARGERQAPARASAPGRARAGRRDRQRGAGPAAAAAGRWFRVRIFAEAADARVAHLAHGLERYAAVSAPDTVCLFHFAVGSAAGPLILEAPDRLVVIYHNITPADFFLGFQHHLPGLCYHGRRQLAAFAERAALALGDSEYNRRELAQAGFGRTGVLPILPDLDAYRRPHSRVVRRLYGDGRTTCSSSGA